MPIRKGLFIVCIILTLLSPLFPMKAAFSQTTGDLDSINNEIATLNDQLNKSVAATKPLQSQLDSMKKQLASIRGQIGAVEADSQLKKKQIASGYKDLATKEDLISRTIRDFYVKSYYNFPFLMLFSTGSAAEITQSIAYQHAKTEQDKSIITNIALSITDLERKKVQLEQEEKFLITARASLDAQSAKLDKVVGDALGYQSELTGKIADLSAKQQEIISAKGGFTFSLSDGELADEYLSSIKGFRESAPAGSFAIFSFGGYTHRNGMSQYGAKGRADAGQSYKDILSKYYPNNPLKEGYSEPATINVQGYGNVDFQQYLYGIAEMPSSWNIEALKAQAVAARSYALTYVNQNKPICIDQNCQAYIGHSKGGAWQQAVDATKGVVLTDGTNPVSTQYSSTTGGYINGTGWDTTDGSGGSNFIDKAYEKLGGSPWLYKAWWRHGTSNSGDTCGLSDPWLSSEEMADIVNAAIAMKAGGIDTTRITPITTSCWGGNPYSMAELRNLVSSKGGISNATSVSVSQGNGTTNSVTINGVTLSGKEFRNAVYLRAPGYISIPQGSPQDGWAFFNIEKK